LPIKKHYCSDGSNKFNFEQPAAQVLAPQSRHGIGFTGILR
jgi:hypothetical protein